MNGRLLLCLLALLCPLASAQEKKKEPGPFDLPPTGLYGWPGVRARYYEELERCKARLEANAADADALERTLDLCNQLGRARTLTKTARAAVNAGNADEAAHLRNRGVLGITLVASANAMGGNFIRFVNGKRVRPEMHPDKKKLLDEAVEHLRAAIKRDRTRPNLRFTLANALEQLQEDPDAENEEVDRLRDEAQSIATREPRPDVGISPYAKQAESLIEKARLAEQAAENPDHTTALELRKKALVLSFCADTIVFDFAPSLYEPVSMLAPRHVVVRTLTRTFTNRAGETDEVAPNYHAASPPRKMRLLQALAKERTNGADAALLALVRGSQMPVDPIADEAARLLAGEGHDPARRGLPVLLAKAVHAADTGRFPWVGQRRLVDLAGALRVTEAAGVLAVALEHDRNLHWPLGIADALGRTGSAEHADALKKVALDTGRAMSFRRAAARAFGRVAPDRLAELDGRPELAIAVAAARYEQAPDESTLGRLLNGLAHDLEVDEAAIYCADLGIAEARPEMESFLRKYAQEKDHPARLVVQRALSRLSAAE